MNAVTFTVPGEPRGKGRPRAVIRGAHAGVYTDSKTVAYESLIAMAAREAMAGREPFDGPVSLVLRIAMQPPRSGSRKRWYAMLDNTIRPTKKPDACNVLAAAQDGMNQIVYRDDKQIVTVVASKWYGLSACLQIWVSEILP